MSIIITTDLHFTDNERDSYRLGILEWLREQVKRNSVSYVFILGDVTDKKDKHPSRLVNSIVEGLCEISEHCKGIFILKGNHDYYEQDTPFFKFLSYLDKVTFITDITEIVLPDCQTFEDGSTILFLPHTRTPEEDWSNLDFSKYDHVFMHETVSGSRASNGQLMEGLNGQLLKDISGKIYSGDIHVPQTMLKDKFIYIGSPYRVHFNDVFRARAILLTKDHETKDLYFPCIKRHTLIIREAAKILELIEDDEIRAGDQVKVKVRLPRSEFVEWQNIKKEIQELCLELNLDLCGIELSKKKRVKCTGADEVSTSKNTTSDRDHKTIVGDYSKEEKLSEAVASTGVKLVSNEE